MKEKVDMGEMAKLVFNDDKQSKTMVSSDSYCAGMNRNIMRKPDSARNR